MGSIPFLTSWQLTIIMKYFILLVVLVLIEASFAKTSAENSGEKVVKKLKVKSGEKLKGGSGEKLKECSGEKLKGSTGGKLKGGSDERSGKGSGEKSKESSDEKSRKSSGEKSGESSDERSRKSSGEKSVERSGEKSGERSGEKSEERSGETSVTTTTKPPAYPPSCCSTKFGCSQSELEPFCPQCQSNCYPTNLGECACTFPGTCQIIQPRPKSTTPRPPFCNPCIQNYDCIYFVCPPSSTVCDADQIIAMIG